MPVRWVLAYVDDLASDFSVYHGIRDVTVLPSQSFLKLAARISAYGGVVARTAAQARRGSGGVRRPQGTGPEKSPAPPGVASAAELSAALAKVPGSDMWGEVKQVKVPPQAEADRP